MTSIIVDLDVTLCNVDHRRHFVENGSPRDWKSFFAGISQDTPNEWCRQLVFARARRHCIIFVSGRDDSHHAVTVDWIEKHLGMREGEHYTLHMRKSGDHRKDSIVKQEIYETLIRPTRNVLFCVDDRASVVKMWRSLGLAVLDCSGKDF